MEEIEEATPAAETPVKVPGSRLQQRRNIGRTVGIVVAVIVILAILGSIGYGLVTHPEITATLRDISIIVLALVTIVIGAFLAILIFQLQSLTALLRDEIEPILKSANETVSTVRGTTTFVSDVVVRPMITMASYATAVRQTIRTLAGSPSRKNKAAPGSEQERT
jgi:hypothetical protein